MLHEIRTQIDNINKSLDWIKQNRPADYSQRFLQLVEDRRTLKKIESAMENNPGIAAFGKSQVGKSYLISCLLQSRDFQGLDVPFMVKSGDAEYNFVYKINPPSEEGGGRESTGVVSRFSSFRRDGSIYNRDLPVLIKTFSVIDIVIIIADSYFNDFSDYSTPGEDEIKKLCAEWESRYANASLIAKPIVTADEILNMKLYFEKHINNAQTFKKNPAIFDRLALLIDRIPVSDYPKVFSNLWNNQGTFTELFEKLLGILGKFDFSDKLYLPIESVLHEGIRENTIMSVQCLKKLFVPGEVGNYTCDVYLRKNDKYERYSSSVPKSEVCAICSEVVFKIEDDFLSSSRPYKWENMGSDVQSVITHGDVKMDILKDNDLLDFPGARAREQEQLKKLSKDNVMDFFLRGKVAYLFNKYNEEMGINILLYCHHNKDNDVTGLYKLLEDWVHNYVGATSTERREKLQKTKISPLFYIGTMFNLDMEFGKGQEMTEKSIDQRWIGRFDTVVNKQCFHRITADWVTNWTGDGVDFNNSYVLRDYKFSTKLYEGFDECGHETASKMTDTYFQMMRKTFVENEHVRRLFARPEVAWDVAATRDNDGALYIIENLTEVASRMNAARDDDFRSMLHKARAHVYDTLKGYFVSSDMNEILDNNIRKANAIFREMDFTCNTDNYYFGHLIQALQITEAETYRIVHDVMQGPMLNDKVNNFRDYEIIRSSCAKHGHPLDAAKTIDDKWNCLIRTYSFDSREEADEFLRRKNVDVEKLFTDSYRKKLNSCVVADCVYDSWRDEIKSVEFINNFASEESFDQMIMTNLVEGMITAAEAIGLKDKMASAIADYVNVVNVHAVKETLLADILASMINDFVLDFGFSLMSDEEKAKARKTCDKMHIPAFDYILRQAPGEISEETLAAMFNDMSTNPRALMPSFEENYNKWLEYMYISFVAHLDIPDIDPEQNNKIKAILDSIHIPA